MSGAFRAALALVMLLMTGAAYAHDSRPVYLEITRLAPSAFSAKLQVPVSVPVENLPELVVPPDCSVLATGLLERTGDSYRKQGRIECAAPVPEFFVAFAYAAGNPSLSTLVRYISDDGAANTEILSPDRDKWVLTARRGLAGMDYLGLGIYHILVGYDHLLFLGSLVWIAGTLRRVLVTVTGFTAAHSLTLGLAAFDVVRLPIIPLEASIALSIVFLANELVKGRRDNLTWRRPVAVSTVFGLLHGFGFAAALGEIGLPSDEMVLSLMLFNLGVEAGQLLVLLLGAALLLVLRRESVTPIAKRFSPVMGQKVFGYLSGIFAAFLVLLRISAVTA